MPEKRNKYDEEFRQGAVRIVAETGKPIAQVARDLGLNEGTLGNWVATSATRPGLSAHGGPATDRPKASALRAACSRFSRGRVRRLSDRRLSGLGRHR